jgi:TM2 domain-containing membrane protein YozV
MSTCAIHPEAAAAAYCRTCGKALCENCRRDVRGVIFCEECIAARVQDTIPGAPPMAVPMVVSGPNPGLAGVLAGFFPFGVAQAYVGQYAKGLAHMAIFVLIIWALSADVAGPLFGIALAFFYVFQIIDAVRSAKAIQLGQPVPDPFGLGAAFASVIPNSGSPSRPVPPVAPYVPPANPGAGAGAPNPGASFAVPPGPGNPGGAYAAPPPPAAPPQREAGLPFGAIVLIGLGILFLLHNLGLFWFNWMHKMWPVILIAVGVWLFIRRRSPDSGQC